MSWDSSGLNSSAGLHGLDSLDNSAGVDSFGRHSSAGLGWQIQSVVVPSPLDKTWGSKPDNSWYSCGVLVTGSFDDRLGRDVQARPERWYWTSSRRWMERRLDGDSLDRLDETLGFITNGASCSLPAVHFAICKHQSIRNPAVRN